jgi:hypothetical protein
VLPGQPARIDDCRRPEERVRPWGWLRWPSALVSARALQQAKQGVHLGRLSGRVSEWVSGRWFGSVHPDRLSWLEGAGEQDEWALAIGEAARGPDHPTTRPWPAIGGNLDVVLQASRTHLQRVYHRV